MKDATPKKEANLHKIEFYNLTPRAITHLKCDRNRGRLAVARYLYQLNNLETRITKINLLQS